MKYQYLTLVLVLGCGSSHHPREIARRVPVRSPVANKVVEHARAQLVFKAKYDATYRRIPFPNGDVPNDRGACTDVIIRALRPLGHDLQKLIYEDKKRNRRLYPDTPLDPNIDHRRVTNMRVYLERHGTDLRLKDWKPGDLILWKLDGALDHIGIVSDAVGESGNLCVIHNLGVIAEEDALANWTIVGHFRYPK